jgi:hypothetical protein
MDMSDEVLGLILECIVADWLELKPENHVHWSD